MNVEDILNVPPDYQPNCINCEHFSECAAPLATLIVFTKAFDRVSPLAMLGGLKGEELASMVIDTIEKGMLAVATKDDGSLATDRIPKLINMLRYFNFLSARDSSNDNNSLEDILSQLKGDN
jgi:hypothetical protein